MLKGASKIKKPVVVKSKAKEAPTYEEYLANRDFTGALTLLEFKLKCHDGDAKTLLLWIGYAAFHLGNFKRAMDAYKDLIDMHDVGGEVYVPWLLLLLRADVR